MNELNIDFLVIKHLLVNNYCIHCDLTQGGSIIAFMY